MQYLDSRRFQRAEIAGGIFGVPLHFLGDLEKATLNNVEQQSLEFVMYCLMHRLIRDRFCSFLPFFAPRLLSKRHF
jgi:phage portal protein BeeE